MPFTAQTTQSDGKSWFSEQEYNALLQKPMPIDLFRPENSGNGVIDLSPLNNPNGGKSAYEFSQAQTTYDGYDGVKSGDPLLVRNFSFHFINFLFSKFNRVLLMKYYYFFEHMIQDLEYV